MTRDTGTIKGSNLLYDAKSQATLKEQTFNLFQKSHFLSINVPKNVFSGSAVYENKQIGILSKQMKERSLGITQPW